MSRATKAVAGGAGLAAVLAIGLPFAEKWEGLRTKPYRDIVGVWTVCVGETNVPMREYTTQQCRDMFGESWLVYYYGMVACFPALKEAPASVQAMATDLAYNNGTGAVCQSKNTGGHLKAKRWREFCNALPSWINAGGKPSKGLKNRRVDSQGVCLEGLR